VSIHMQATSNSRDHSAGWMRAFRTSSLESTLRDLNRDPCPARGHEEALVHIVDCDDVVGKLAAIQSLEDRSP
jgi:hypothetical protein